MMGDKKIMAISMMGSRPAVGIAGWKDSKLFIMEINEQNCDPYIWMENMVRDLGDKAKKGWVTLIEDPTNSFPAPATAWSFDYVGEDRRTNFHTVMNWYLALQSRGALILEKPVERFSLRVGNATGMIEIINDEHGRQSFKVNWPEFSCSHRALLMCVAGACMEEPLSDRWMNIFAGNIPKAKKPNIWPVFRVMKDLWRKQQLDVEARIEAMERQKHVQR